MGNVLADFRAKYPQYKDVPDGKLAAAIRKKYYPQMEPVEFYRKAGLQHLVGDTGPDNPTDGMSTWDRLRAGIGKSFVDTAEGIGQLFGITSQDEVDDRRQRDRALMDTGAGLAGNVTGQVAQMFVPLGTGAKVGGLLGRAKPIADAALQGAAFAGLQPVATGESRASNAAAGAAFGAGGQALAGAGGRLIRGASDRIAPQARAVIARAEQAGIPLHMSQVVDSKPIKTASSALNYLPFSGAGKAAERQQEAFNAAVGRSFGADATTLSDDVIAQARKNIGKSYDDIYSRNTVTLDDAALARLGQIEQDAIRNLPPDEAKIVRNQIEDLLAQGENGAMTGKAYQAFRTDRLMRLEMGPKSFLTGQIREIRRTLDEAAERSVGPKDAARLAKTRGQYRNLRTAEQALRQVEGSKGNVRPASLWPIVNGKKGASPEMRELAQIGQLIKDPIPDSGTAARLAIYGGLGAAGGGAAMSDNAAVSDLGKMLLLGATAGRIGNSQAAARYLTRGIPQAQGLARLVPPAARRQLPRSLAVLPAAAGEPMEIDIAGGTPGAPISEAELAELRRRAYGY